MNKLVGYTELKINGEVIPVKFSLRALEFFMSEYGVKLNDLPTLFEMTTFIDPNTNKESIAIMPKELIKFLAISIWAGANYVAERNGKGLNYYSLDTVYDEWLNEIGLVSKEGTQIISTFSNAILNGGTLPKQIDEVETENTKEIKKKNLTSTV